MGTVDDTRALLTAVLVAWDSNGDDPPISLCHSTPFAIKQAADALDAKDAEHTRRVMLDGVKIGRLEADLAAAKARCEIADRVVGALRTIVRSGRPSLDVELTLLLAEYVRTHDEARAALADGKEEG